MRFKIVAWTLLILSVVSFVLPAPVAVREVREACADAVEGGENVITVSGKRALPNEGAEGDLSPSDTEWGTSPSPSQSSSPPNYAGGSHSGVDTPSSSSGGSESLFSKVWSVPGRTGEPLGPDGAFKPGTTTENPPASSSNAKKVNFWHTTKVHFFEPDRPVSESQDKPAPLLPLPPGREGYLAKVAAQQSPSPEYPSSSSYFDPAPSPGREGYLAKVAGQQSPPPSPGRTSPSSDVDLYPPPQSKGFVSKFKTYFGKLGKLKFRPRFQRTVDT